MIKEIRSFVEWSQQHWLLVKGDGHNLPDAQKEVPFLLSGAVV